MQELSEADTYFGQKAIQEREALRKRDALPHPTTGVELNVTSDFLNVLYLIHGTESVDATSPQRMLRDQLRSSPKNK